VVCEIDILFVPLHTTQFSTSGLVRGAPHGQSLWADNYGP